MATYERKDAVYKRAQKEGYRSRAAYKLMEVDERFKLFRGGLRVVDLGCWPGAWTQVAAQKVTPSGRVVGIDLVETDPFPQRHIRVLTGDVADDAVVEGVRDELGGPADLVLSDMAPKLTGIKHADAVRHAELVHLAIRRARDWLAPDGALVLKLFMDGEYQELIAELRRNFRSVKSSKPGSTRKGSSELYTVARTLKPAP